MVVEGGQFMNIPGGCLARLAETWWGTRSLHASSKCTAYCNAAHSALGCVAATTPYHGYGPLSSALSLPSHSLSWDMKPMQPATNPCNDGAAYPSSAFPRNQGCNTREAWTRNTLHSCLNLPARQGSVQYCSLCWVNHPGAYLVDQHFCQTCRHLQARSKAPGPCWRAHITRQMKGMV